MDNPDVVPTFLGRQLYPFHFARGDQSQQMSLQLGVVLYPIFPRAGTSRPDLAHGKPRSAPSQRMQVFRYPMSIGYMHNTAIPVDQRSVAIVGISTGPPSESPRIASTE